MIQNKNYRYFLFAALYFVQGAILSYFITFNILYLREFKYTTAEVGFFQSLLAIPFILKIFFGLISDAWNPFKLGHRKPFIIFGLILQAIAMYAITYICPKTNLETFAIIALIASTGMALYDTCTDGLALDTSTEKDRGIVQGIMIGGRAAGVLVLLLGGGIIKDAIGWNWIFHIEAILPLALIPFVMFVKEPDEKTIEPFHWSSFKDFKKPAILVLSAIGIIYALTIDGIYTFLSDYLRNDLSLSVIVVSQIIAIAMAGRIVGALSSSLLSRIFNRKTSLLIAIGITIAGSASLAIGSALYTVAIAAFFFGLAYGYYTAVYGVVAMDFSHQGIAASMFAIFMMFINIGTVVGQSLGGTLTQSFGFKSMSVIMGLLNIINIFLVIILFNLIKKKKEA